MAFISLTRLRIRSWLYMPQFAWRTLQSTRQVQRAAGFLSGRLLREANNAFWTLTAWESEAAMRAYRSSGPHLAAMPKLLDWCDEASVAHWEQHDAELPDWAEAHRRMVAEGRMSKVRCPSAAQEAKRIPPPSNTNREGRDLKPN